MLATQYLAPWEILWHKIKGEKVTELKQKIGLETRFGYKRTFSEESMKQEIVLFLKQRVEIIVEALRRENINMN